MNTGTQLPSFLFVGTAKAGTTSIYHYLRQHPAIRIPVKETFFFLRDLYKQNALTWPSQRKQSELVLNEEKYLELYRNLDPYLTGEIGTGYLYHWRESIPEIKQMLGEEVKIIIILREPASRCFSSYMHFVKDLHEPHSFEESLKAEADRKAAGWDFMWMHYELGLYAEQVEAYMKAFKHVKVMIYEEFVQDTTAGMRDLFDYLGVPPLEHLEDLKTFNPSGEARNVSLQKFITHENPFKSLLRPLFRLFFSKEKRERIRKDAKSRNLKKGQKMPAEVRVTLKEAYADDVARLEGLLGRKIDAWR